MGKVTKKFANYLKRQQLKKKIKKFINFSLHKLFVCEGENKNREGDFPETS